jgi:hypothetical protein
VAHCTGAVREPHEFLDRVGVRHIAQVEAHQDRGLRVRAGERTL